MTQPDDVEHDDPVAASGYRTYEIFQRERVGEATPGLRPRELIGDEMLTDPHRLLTILRESDPCFRDWKSNRFWITRYDDVTSILTDDANFETRPKRWGDENARCGRNLLAELPVAWARANRIDENLVNIVERIITDVAESEEPDLATGFAARLPLELWGTVLDIPMGDLGEFSARLWRMERSTGWEPRARADGLAAFDELVAYFEPLLAERRRHPGDDLLSAAGSMEVDGSPVTATDVVATILEADHETLHGGLANLWFQLLTHPDQLAYVREEPRMVKYAWLEALRHSPPVMSAARFARHEVERFGRLLPDGALLWCSAGAANRDPRVFDHPDAFIVGRRDLCQREPRGHHRADGLPSGIAVGLGPPSVHPAVPKERPRSLYAITRDVAVAASGMLLERFPRIRLADGAEPALRSLRLGEMYTCWSLPVTW